MVLVDTSALIALLDRSDPHHPPARSAFESLLSDSESLVSHNYVAVESMAVAQRRLGLRSARDLVERFFPLLNMIWVTQELHDAGTAALLSARRRRLSLVDCVSFEVMRRQGIDRAFAFDPDFAAAGFDVVGTSPIR